MYHFFDRCDDKGHISYRLPNISDANISPFVTDVWNPLLKRRGKYRSGIICGKCLAQQVNKIQATTCLDPRVVIQNKLLSGQESRFEFHVIQAVVYLVDGEWAPLLFFCAPLAIPKYRISKNDARPPQKPARGSIHMRRYYKDVCSYNLKLLESKILKKSMPVRSDSPFSMTTSRRRLDRKKWKTTQRGDGTFIYPDFWRVIESALGYSAGDLSNRLSASGGVLGKCTCGQSIPY